MKRPLGLSLFGWLFILWGISCLARNPGSPAEESLLLRSARIVFTILTFAIGVGLLQRRPWTLRAYVVWVGLILVVGGLTEYYTGQVPAWAVLVVMSLIGSAYVALGFYLRGALNEPAT